MASRARAVYGWRGVASDMEGIIVRGRVVPGLGVGGKYISHPYYMSWFERILGCKPFPGTLNIDTNTDWRELAMLCKPEVIPETTWNGRRLGAVYVWHAEIPGVDAELVLIRPLLSAHKPGTLEIVACKKLRDVVRDEVVVKVRCRIEDRLLRELLASRNNER